MNVVRSREQLKELQKAGIISEAHYKSYLESPVFVYKRSDTAFSQKEIDWCNQNICGDFEAKLPTKLPFEFCTIITTIKDTPHRDISCVLRATSNPHDFIVNVDGEKIKSRCLLALHLSIQIDGVDCVMAIRHTGQIKRGVVGTIYKNLKPCQPPKEDDILTRYADSVAVPREILMRFCFDVFNPNSVVLRVEPPKSNVPRSVEWRMARTHYLILNRKQAVACREQKRGPTDGEIERAAHWRRAHMRRLTSDKFIHKKGLLVFVKQAWIGPDEWIGLDDKTYKVFNPIKPA